MSGAVYEQDDNVGSSHDADVDAGFEDDQQADDPAAGAGGQGGQTSADADVDAAYEDD